MPWTSRRLLVAALVTVTCRSGVPGSESETVAMKAATEVSVKAGEDTLVRSCCTLKKASWTTVGAAVGTGVGLDVGSNEGAALGIKVGSAEGVAVGVTVG